MRRLLTLFLLLLPASSPAGLRATYAGSEPGRALVIEVGDDGAARIGEVGAPDYGIWRDGHFHVVSAAAGQMAVARSEDVAAAIDQVVAPIFGDTLARADAAAMPAVALRREDKGARTVAGVAGRAWAVYGLDPAQPAAAADYVFSDDPRLAPVGRALEGFMNAALLPLAPLVGRASAETAAQTRALFALGTPLVAGDRLTLERLETLDVPAARLELPTRPQTREALVRLMRESAGR